MIHSNPNATPSARLPRYFPATPAAILIVLGCLLFPPGIFATPAPRFSQIVVFGDSYSDNGNVSQRIQSQTGGSIEPLSYSLGKAVDSASQPSNPIPPNATLPQVWIAARTDGVAGSGTIANPYDGSTAEKLDHILAAIPAGREIHLAAGHYTTRGVHPKEGWRLRGAGKFATTIMLANGTGTIAAPNAFVVSHFDNQGFLNYFEMSDLTLDCNRDQQPVYTTHQSGFLNAWNIGAINARITNVRALGTWASPGEGFPCAVFHGGGNVGRVDISGCDNINPIGYLTAISVCDQGGGAVAGSIRNCTVTDLADGCAFGSGGWKNFAIADNYVKNVKSGIIIDSFNYRDIAIYGNHFLDLGQYAVVFNGSGVYQNIEIHDNFFESSPQGQAAVVLLTSDAKVSTDVYNNVIKQGKPGFPTLWFGTHTSGSVRENTIVETTSTNLSACLSMVVSQNHDMNGQPLSLGRSTASPPLNGAIALTQTAGVSAWHAQLAQAFLRVPPATDSLGGGLNYSFGGASAATGTDQRNFVSLPEAGAGAITIDNVGQQVESFLAAHPVDAQALYVVWGGNNDLIDDDSAAHVTTTAQRMGELVEELANAGARNFVVPNSPPLGALPHYRGDAGKIASLNAASVNYRAQLASVLAATKHTLNARGINAQIYSADVWSRLLRTLAEPAKYGFTDVQDSAKANAAANPDKYLFWDDIHLTKAGRFQIAAEVNGALSASDSSPGIVANLSTRAAVGTGENVLIQGFVVSGHDAKKVILRALGPSLASSGVHGVLTDPILSLYDHSGRLLASNDNWRTTQQAAITATTIAPPNNLESAIVATLPPGSYTCVVGGKNNRTGVAIAEIYDLSPASDSTLANVSTRGFVGTGENVLIGGFIVGSGDSPLLTVRAIGPTLAKAGIAHALADPVLELRNGNGVLIASNDDWQTRQSSAITVSGLAPADDHEATIVTSLQPGSYTAVVHGKGNATGIALVEVYRIQ